MKILIIFLFVLLGVLLMISAIYVTEMEKRENE